MEFVPTSLSGAFLVEPTVHRDERGWFARIRCSRELADHALPAAFVQTNLSHNRLAGTFRGLHFQDAPSAEGKLVRCIAGAIDDIIVDLRPDSPTFLEHEWLRLDAQTYIGLYVPPGFAHGFMTRTDGSTVLYEMSDYYAPESSRGLRWNDPSLSVTLPMEIAAAHPRDLQYPDLDVASLDGFRNRC